MVSDYHLVRDAQLRAVESLDRRDEIDRLMTFKEWLRVYEWDTDPRRGHEPATATTTADQCCAEGDTVWGDGGREQAAEPWVPQQRVPVAEADPVAHARRAVAAIPDFHRAPAGDGWPLPYTASSADVDDDRSARDETTDELAAVGSPR